MLGLRPGNTHPVDAVTAVRQRNVPDSPRPTAVRPATGRTASVRPSARWALWVLVALGSMILAGCSSSSSTPATTATTVTTATTPTTATSSKGAVNLPVTNQVRAELLAAGAASNDIPVSQYTGLAPGLTYLALDRATETYWAGARLVPAPSSDPSSPTRAQVASQDDGSYYIFRQPSGGGWTAYAAGASGPDTPCPVAVPPTVTAVWGWTTGSCRPAGA